MSLASPPTQPPKKTSFFRRLSLSGQSPPRHPSTSNDHPPLPPKSSNRGVSNPTRPWDGDVLGGPQYNTLPPGAAPSAWRTEHQDARRQVSAGPSGHEGYSRGGVSAEPNGIVPDSRRRSASTSARAQTSPPRNRNPIHAALASPPTSPPRASSASPYDVGGTRRSQIINPLADAPGTFLRRGQESAAVSSTSIPRATSIEIIASSTAGLSLQPTAQSNGAPRRASDLHQFDDADAHRAPGLAQAPASRNAVSARRSQPQANRPRPEGSMPTRGLSEASAYALAVAPSLVRRHDSPRPSAGPLSSTGERRVSRPLPRPPSISNGPGASTVHVIASSRTPTHVAPLPRSTSTERVRPRISIPNTELSAQPPMVIDFPRSPTLPPLIDPSQSAAKPNPIEEWSREANVPRPAPLKQLPRRTSSAAPQSKRIVSPFTSPVFTSPQQMPSPQMVATHHQRDSPFLSALSHTSFQAALLPFLSINSFLSLSGSSDVIRQLFSGEVVGRWVLREWGIHVDRERGRTWPNLTVWEGAMESLLHDPATYCTYPTQWHNLLQHLCLSHSLIVLFLRTLPPSAFSSTPMPFDDDAGYPVFGSMGNMPWLQRPSSRVGSAAGSDSGSIGKMPRHERVIEIVMPEPLAAKAKEEVEVEMPQLRRRGSIGSISSMASAATKSFGRKRSNSIAASVISSSKVGLPPVSYPTAKRYGFRKPGETSKSRTSSDSGRPGSVFSMSSSPSLSFHPRMATSSLRSGMPPVPNFPAGLVMPPPIGGHHRSSVASSGTSRKSEIGGSPIPGRWGSPALLDTRVEPAFDQSLPYNPGRAPILRVFVPLSGKVKRWPSAEGALAVVRELDKCGATRRLRLGDIVVNTALRRPKGTEHVLIFVPFVRHLLVPLEYVHCNAGHLPAYINAFSLPPSYYYPFLPSPHIIHLNLAPYAKQAMESLRLAADRRDVTVASGARISAKRYLHVAGFEVGDGDEAAPEWRGLVSVEADGTAEGRRELERRLGSGDPSRAVMGPWELIREKSMAGTVWLRLVKDR